MNRQEAMRLINLKMGKQPLEAFTSFTRGEVTLFEKIIQRTKTSFQGPDWKEHDIEKGRCPSDLHNLFRAAHYSSFEWAERSFNKLREAGLVTVAPDGIVPHPSVLLDYPNRIMQTAKTHAQRQRTYRERQKQQQASEVLVNG